MVKRDSNFNPLGSSRGVRRHQGGIADWASADPSTVVRSIEAAANIGGALRFGYSRDGGAYAIGIYGDGEPYTEFVRPAEDINAFLLDIIELYEGIGDDRKPNVAAAQAKKKPPQGQE